MVSFNGATRLILRHELLCLGLALAHRHFNRSELPLYPLERDRAPRLPGNRCPLVLTSAITLSISGNQAALVAGNCQLVPSRSMAQQRTNNLLPTATIAIFLRDFLPPEMR